MKKYAHPKDDGKPYYKKGDVVPATIDLTHTAQAMTMQHLRRHTPGGLILAPPCTMLGEFAWCPAGNGETTL